MPVALERRLGRDSDRMKRQKYSLSFLDQSAALAEPAARVIVPLILSFTGARSVVDVGCGTGSWLKVFSECGVDDILGMDGAYVDKRQLRIPEPRFVAVDLSCPVVPDRQFDLVVCLEVGEHLSAELAAGLVNFLTAMGPVVLFSAAIPFQKGTHHVNEQWPDYWAKLFEGKGYVFVDCIRKRVWNDNNISYFYAQNMLVYVEKSALSRYPALEKEFDIEMTAPLALVHPALYLGNPNWQEGAAGKLCEGFAGLFLSRVGKKLRSLMG